MGKKEDFWSTDQFRKAKATWDAKLLKDGFRDIESINPRTSLPYDTMLLNAPERKFFSAEREIAEAHFSLAREFARFLSDRRKDMMDRARTNMDIWNDYCDALPPEECHKKAGLTLVNYVTHRDYLVRRFKVWSLERKKNP
jgi:hypothetical protein